MRGSIPRPWSHDLSGRQMLNGLSHPGAPPPQFRSPISLVCMIAAASPLLPLSLSLFFFFFLSVVQFSLSNFCKAHIWPYHALATKPSMGPVVYRLNQTGPKPLLQLIFTSIIISTAFIPTKRDYSLFPEHPTHLYTSVPSLMMCPWPEIFSPHVIAY